jgi:hypothetical protein
MFIDALSTRAIISMSRTMFISLVITITIAMTMTMTNYFSEY